MKEAYKAALEILKKNGLLGAGHQVSGAVFVLNSIKNRLRNKKLKYLIVSTRVRKFFFS